MPSACVIPATRQGQAHTQPEWWGSSHGRAIQMSRWQRRHSIPARVRRVHREGISEGRAGSTDCSVLQLGLYRKRPVPCPKGALPALRARLGSQVSTRILGRRTAHFPTIPYSSPRPAWLPKILVLTRSSPSPRRAGPPRCSNKRCSVKTTRSWVAVGAAVGRGSGNPRRWFNMQHVSFESGRALKKYPKILVVAV